MCKVRLRAILKVTAMTRKTARDFAPELLELFDRYVHGLLSRRGFLQAAARYSMGMAGAEFLLQQLSPNFAMGQQVAPTDTRIQVSTLEYASPQGHGTMRGYLARPADAAAKLPAVVVVHENRGLTPHIQDIARRLAIENFIAFAPDALAPLGGYPGDEDKARDLFERLDPAKTRADFVAAAGAVKSLPQCSGKVGVVGFCFGGGIANHLATQIPDLAAAVPFYGTPPSAEAAAHIKAPLLLHYAGNDNRTNAGWTKYEAALKAAHVRYEAYLYPGVEHGFHNDTTPRYDPDAAKLAWQRTLAFLNQTLRG
jgi:carboxymethylenebutenolidase